MTTITQNKKHWSRIDEEIRLCRLWLQEPLVNPETGYPIERDGPTFNEWRQRCKVAGIQSRPTATKTVTWRKCQEWRNHPDINPDTGRKITRDGPIFKWLTEQCQLIEEKELVLEGIYYIPDKKGMVPCILYRGTWYVVRQHEGRRIWGPLNKPAKQIRLCYYLDTWDYHYNHYKPVFLDGGPPKRTVNKRKTVGDPKNFTWLEPKLEPPKENCKYIVDNVVNLFISNPTR